MPLIPEIVSFDTQIEPVKVGFFGYYRKSENVYIHWYDLKDGKLITRFSREFNSSVWIHDEGKYESFARIYTVISGGWYGDERGGRWNTLKKTDGEITFEGIQNFKRNEHSKSSNAIFTIRKPFFTNMIRVEINNEIVGHLTFYCKRITFIPSNKIYLHCREKNEYVNATHILEPGGLGLVESNFN